MMAKMDFYGSKELEKLYNKAITGKIDVYGNTRQDAKISTLLFDMYKRGTITKMQKEDFYEYYRGNLNQIQDDNFKKEYGKSRFEFYNM